MPHQTEAITTATLSLALDAAALRQQVIATNIANANTEGYVPQRVSFESRLEDARRMLREGGSLDPSALPGMQPQLESVMTASGEAARVQLDAEVAAMSRNSVHYEALARGLSRHFSILLSAVSDGRK